jgi:hypothetical protein
MEIIGGYAKVTLKMPAPPGRIGMDKQNPIHINHDRFDRHGDL